MPPPPPSDQPPLLTVGYTGAPDTFVVPSGEPLIEVRLWVAGDIFAIRSVLVVTPGETLDVRVGGPPDGAGGGGWPGGGNGVLVVNGATTYNTGGQGLTDIARAGTILTTAGGTGAGYGVTEDAVQLAGSGTNLIVTTLPGPGDPDRAVLATPVTAATDVSGLVGGVEVGADTVTNGAARASGAGGGGYGGGASGSIYTLTSGVLTGLTFADTGRGGTHYGPPGFVEKYEGTDPRGSVLYGLIEVFTPGGGGWRIGSLGMAVA